MAGDSFGLRQGESQMPESVGGSATAQDDPIVGAVISVSECVICKPFSQKSRNKMISFEDFYKKKIFKLFFLIFNFRIEFFFYENHLIKPFPGKFLQRIMSFLEV